MCCGGREDRAGVPRSRGSRGRIQSGDFVLEIRVGLWEKSRQFVGKIISVCGKNSVSKVKCWIIPVSLWEKFSEQSTVLDNSRQFVGKIR